MAMDARETHASQLIEHVRRLKPEVVRLPEAVAESPPVVESWPHMRGETRLRETVELIGGFPGSAAFAGRMKKAHVAVTDTWLIVNEDRNDGFALPLDAIESLTVVPAAARGRYAVQLRYRERQDHRTFYLRFPEAIWPFRSGTDALEMATFFADRDIDVCQFDADASRISLAMRPADMREAALEPMVWSGHVEAPIGGWLGQSRADCDVWLTTTSLMWRPIDAAGVNRVRLADIITVTTGTWLESGAYPVAIISLLDGLGDRHELPFVFNTGRDADADRRECAAAIGGFRKREVAVSSQRRPVQPWRDLGSLLQAAEDEADAAPLARHSGPVAPAEFEAHCLIEIARLNRDIVGYDEGGSMVNLEPVVNLSHAAAITELERRCACGDLSAAAMKRHRARFAALIEARGKLAAIARQRSQGTRPAAILLHQRDAVMQALNEVIMPQLEDPGMDIVTDAPFEPRGRLKLIHGSKA
jgi:hypothetical protein